ncbi:MAG TPA: transporter substrate-binding domain-containing protein [Spirochaetota bacterium]|nr:transporter substrate-binding domain-containing protein [Spirochaetota bacterium]
MRNCKITIYILFLSAVIAIFSCITGELCASSKYIAVANYDHFPYEYLNTEGKPAGFTVELFREIAARSGIDYTLLLLPSERIKEIIEKGEADVLICGVKGGNYKGYTCAGAADKILFSFAATGETRISCFRDLYGKSIAVTGHEIFSGPVSDIIRKLYRAEVLFINNPDTAVILLNSGGCDALFMQDFRLREIADKLGDGSLNLLPISPGLLKYCYFVKDGNNILKDIITGELTDLRNDGSYRRIYSRWFDTPEKIKNSLNRRFILIWSAVSIAVFSGFIFLNTFILKRRVNERTSSLSAEVTVLKNRITKIQGSEKKFRKVFGRMPSAVLILDSSGQVVHFNEAAKRVFGFSDPGEIYNLNLIESPNATEWFKNRMRKYHSVSVEFNYDFDFIRENGFYRTSRTGMVIIDALILPISLDEESDRPGYICYFTDVTGNRQLLQKRKETARRYKIIFDSIRDGLWEWRLDDDSVRFNRQYVNLLGYRKDRLPRTFNGICELIHPEERDSVITEIRERISSGRSFMVEYRVCNSDGLWLWIRTRGEITEWDHELSPTVVVATHIDITELKRSDENKYTGFSHMQNDNNKISGANESEQRDSLRGKKILIVDDNCLITLHLSEILTRSGCLCVNASSGVEAVEIVKRDSELDVVLLDLDMPELDGMTTMKLIKDIKTDIPVIANTGHYNSGCMDELLFSGFDDVLGKPVQDVILKDKISRLTADRSGETGDL